ncbi:MAG: GH92 family glycosyl hydrolase [Eubacteriales bacterium]
MKQKTPAEYVNPYIGTVGHLLTATRPATMLPHGTAQVFPNVSPNMNDYYFAEKIASFPIDECAVMFAGKDTQDFESAVSHFDMSTVESHPYSYSVYLEDSDISVEASTTMRSYVYRASGAEKIFIRAPHKAECTITADGILISENRRVPSYIYIKLSCAFDAEANGNEVVISDISDCCELYASVSHISFAKAEEIFARELGGKNYEAVAAQSKQVWESLLGRIKVSGGSEDMKTAYYTALYRSFGNMKNFGEYGKYYSGYDNAVHDGEFYCNDQLWDSFRSMHPLQLLLEPENHKKMLDSYVEMYRQSGAMPSFPYIEGDRPVMIGFHAAALFADALAKGIEADYETAYEGLYRSATQTTMLPWVADKPANELDRCYYEKGFFPSLEVGQKEWIADAHSFERRQCLSVTLEHAYDDWCIAQIARHLGKTEDYDMFMKRSQNYRNIYNSEIGFMAPKNASGEWIKGYDPVQGGGQGGRDYFAECNAYTFNFSVWHDIEGLANLMGGKDKMCGRLDELFTTPAPGKYGFLNQFPDSTGLMGMFCMGNEPSFHIPYLYNYCGKPWMTQRRLRTIIELWFTNSPLGICGDEDSGAMSSWMAFSAIGLYPVCPGKAEYALSSPMFDKVEIEAGGKTFVIKADGAGDGKRYIKSAKLNGRDHNKPFLSHSDITSGGELILEMSDKPNREWGTEQ